MLNLNTNYPNLVIIGGGIAGLSTAYLISKHLPVLIIHKGNTYNPICSTYLAQGGIAGSKNWLSHYQDTMQAGDNINNSSIVEMFCKSSLESINFLRQEIKVPFHIHPTLEGGHSEYRIWHTGDNTGQIIYQKLLLACLKQKNIKWLTNSQVFRLQKNANYHNFIINFRHFNNNYSLLAEKIVLATGGIGGLFKYSTNPLGLNGDGLLLANQLGANLENLNIIQFHPTGLKINKSPVPLISEALRGEGAYLVNEQHQRFLNHLSAKELSPRHIVVAESLKQQQVFLDLRHKPSFFWQHRFPHIYKNLLKHGFNISQDLIPVVATEHFLSGGIKVDANSLTNIANLYAIGECASTGLHGNNRLASNSLAEALVFAKNSVSHILHRIPANIKFSRLTKLLEKSESTLKFANHQEINQIRNSMQNNLSAGNKNKIQLKIDLNRINDCFEKEIAMLFTK